MPDAGVPAEIAALREQVRRASRAYYELDAPEISDEEYDLLFRRLQALESAHPGFKERLLDEQGGLRRFVNVFVADDDVRYLDGLGTPVPDGETVSIIPAVAGG